MASDLKQIVHYPQQRFGKPFLSPFSEERAPGILGTEGFSFSAPLNLKTAIDRCFVAATT